jgi:hypothetical protein
MKRRYLTVIASAACALGAAAAAAQTPFNGTLQCSAPDPNYSVSVGDIDGHREVLQKSICSVTQVFALANQMPLQDSLVFSGDMQANRISGSGSNVITMENGDVAVFSYRANVAISGGVPKSSAGTFQWISGTGKLKGISGGGTITGTYTSDGSVTLTIQGTYAIRAGGAGSSP